jgi:uncharacterized protein YdeI (YjbR/CyaY-like superfamily)
MDSKVDAHLSSLENWQKELRTLQRILLDCGLHEALKWSSPCYSFQQTNIIIIGGFKTNCVISFFKGALLSDTDGVLQKPGENSQSARIIRFTSVKEIVKMEATLKAYIYEAIELEKAGLKVEFKKSDEYDVPEEFQVALKKYPKLKAAFYALTPGRQRAYLLHFSSAKQSATRTSRIEKCMPLILKGQGINDCTCGLSKKMPYCDGSHKSIR